MRMILKTTFSNLKSDTLSYFFFKCGQKSHAEIKCGHKSLNCPSELYAVSILDLKYATVLVLSPHPTTRIT